MKSRIPLLGAVLMGSLLALPACLGDGGPPSINPVPPASCGNGVCEIEVEGCVNCPGDCDCCAVVDAQGEVPNAAELPFAQGQPDAQVVQLDAFADLYLTLGSEATDLAVVGGKELTIHGSVTTSDELFAQCPEGSNGQGAVEVWAVGQAGERLIGIWTAQTTTFDLVCGEVRSTTLIHLRAQPGTVATFDALTVAADACRGGKL